MNLNQHLNPKHTELFKSTDLELCVRGGANAGKTYSIADKLLIQSMIFPDIPLKVLVVKETQPSLRDTVIDVLSKRAELFGFPLKINQQTLTGRLNKMQFLFRSMHNKEDYRKVKSMTDVDFVWINEITEIREPDYRMIKSRKRGGKCPYSQMIFDFNPVGKTSWVYQRFFERNIGNCKKLKYTVLDNPWAKPHEIEELRATQYDDPNYYKIYFEGEWGELEGVIYNWDVVPLPNPDRNWYDEIFYGGDFGYSVDPAAVVKIYRKANEFWVQEIIYATGLTNIELGREMRRLGVYEEDSVYFDSAEPKSIEELYQLGFNVYPSSKGADSVRAGIDYLKEQKIHIVEGSQNIQKEQRSYIWKKDKDGNPLNEPIRINNHAMDAIRYGIYTHIKDRVDGEVLVLG